MEDLRLKRIRVVGLGILAFMLMLTYSIVRPATESLFLEYHSSKQLPVVWLLVAVGMIGAVALYNWVVARHDLVRLHGDACAISAIGLSLLTLASYADVPGVYYALYVLKDVYIVVLVEIYYSYANSVFPIKTARWVYGLFGVLAAAGGVAGNLIVGPVALRFGTANTLWLAPPLLMIIWAFCIPFARMAGIGTPIEKKYGHARMTEACRVVRKSSYLFLILLVVWLLQIISTLIDFEYNKIIEHAYPAMDIRTGMMGKIYAIMNFGALVLHALTGPILRLATVPVTLVAIPVLLGTGVGIFIAAPAFLVMAAVKVANKCFDYTLYRSGKEILYIPLSYEEKTLGKSIVDMLSHRIAKGCASLLLLGLIAINAGRMTIWMTLVLTIVWLAITTVTVIRFRRKVSREQEMSSDVVAR